MPVELLAPEPVAADAEAAPIAEQARPYFEMHENSATVFLARPVSAHAERFDRFEIKRPTAGQYIDARAASSGDEAQIDSRLLAATADVPYSTIRTLDLRDYQKCLEALTILGGF